MTLAQIVERLERIEDTESDGERLRLIVELRLDLEMALIKAGQL